VTGPIRIVKMSGAGNDFVVLGPREAESLGDRLESWVRRVCRRGLSVGADGVLVVGPSSPGRIRVSFFNPDGAPAFCGNGSRCAARFAALEGYAAGSMILETVAGDVPARLTENGVRLTLPAPSGGEPLAVEAAGTVLDGWRIVAGVPHFVLAVADVARAPLEIWGPALRRHPAFGEEGTNVDLAERRPDGIGIRTWERGVEGETLACGSGAVAAACLARRLGWAGGTVRVVPASGIPLFVDLPGPADAPEAAVLEGDARWIFDGTLAPEATEGFEA
jgi:diaminopimelate epimerase